MTLAHLERAVDAGHPPIVDLQAWRDFEHPWPEVWDAGHYCLLVGYDHEHLFFMDPSVLTVGAYAYMPRHELERAVARSGRARQPAARADDDLREGQRAAVDADATPARHGRAPGLAAPMPSLLSSVRAQTTAVETLRRALAGDRVHHAYLFDGPEGVGKERAAFGLAQALVCERRPPGGTEACGACSACTRSLLREGERRPVHPDVAVLERGLYDKDMIGRSTPETQDISINQVRTLVLSRAAFPPHEGRAKVFIVRRAEELSIAAANALLKTLEEPGQRTHFILLLVHARRAAADDPVAHPARALRGPARGGGDRAARGARHARGAGRGDCGPVGRQHGDRGGARRSRGERGARAVREQGARRPSRRPTRARRSISRPRRRAATRTP